MTVDVAIALWKPGMPPVRDAEDLSRYVQQVYSKKNVLQGGQEISDFGGITALRVGAQDVVVATAADLYHIKPIVLESGGLLTLKAYQHYFIRLNDRVVAIVRFFHWNLKKLTPQWHAEAQAKAIAIIERIRATPRP